MKPAPSLSRTSCPIQILLAVLTLWSAMWLTACGGGSDKQASPADMDAAPINGIAVDPDDLSPALGTLIQGNFLPFDSGSRWIYKVSGQDSATGPYFYVSRQQVESIKTVDGITSIEISDINPETGEGIGTYHLRLLPDRLAQFSNDGNRSLDLLRLPLRMGQRYTQDDRVDEDTGYDADGDGVNDTVSTHTEVLVAGVESVQTSAGRFPRALKVMTMEQRTYRYSRSGGRLTMTRNSTDWYADGHGLVRATTTYSRKDWTASLTHDLLAYRIGNRMGDITPPRVVNANPAEGSTQGARPIINAELSEIPDRESLKGAVQLLGPDGKPVAGEAVYESGKFTFTPAANLHSGIHTFSIAGTLSDALGNQTGQNFYRHFTVDADAPSVIAVSPANGASALPLNTTISLEFSEPISPYIYQGIQLIPEGDTLGINVNLVVDGSRVLLTPTRPLNRGVRYEIVVSNHIKDLLGNAMPEEFRAGFTTEIGQFLTPVKLPTSASPVSTAIRDLNQDGLPDVVALIGDGVVLSASAYNKLYVFPQKTDGTLADGQIYPLEVPWYCGVERLVIADIDNDRTPEILFTNGGGCGVGIMARTPEGGWIRRGLFTSATLRNLRAADVDHDGLTDLVGLGLNDNNITIWFQKPGGGMADPVRVPIKAGSRPVMAIRDLNRDGLEDILICISDNSLPKQIGIVSQQPGRKFSATYLNAIQDDVTNNLANIAAGDINQDGRPDIAVTYTSRTGQIGVFLQNANGRFPAQPLIIENAQLPYGLALADFNRDGRTDLLTTHPGGGGGGLNYLPQDNNGGFPVRENYRTFYDLGFNTDTPSVGDINSDGYPDLVLANHGLGVEVIYNNAANLPTLSARNAAKKRPAVPQPLYPLEAFPAP